MRLKLRPCRRSAARQSSVSRRCRAIQVQEEEAAEIGGELLIPIEAAKKLARRKATNEEVALQFGVSVEMARWRMDATGARLIAARQAAAYQRARGA
jgi:Zn-dependent peptidase ImmA (M78 family)